MLPLYRQKFVFTLKIYCMKLVKTFLSIAVAFVCASCFYSCQSDDNGEEGSKVTSTEDYILTVASHKVEGVWAPVGGNPFLAELLAVKKDGSKDWKPLYSISGFNYEVGYEYRVRINETSYLDYRMGDPAWTELKILEVISKERKESEGLPENFIPEWYKELDKK